METLLELIIEIIMLVLFRYPGAFVRWIYKKGKVPYKVVLNEGDFYTDGIIGIIIIVGLGILIKKIFW